MQLLDIVAAENDATTHDPTLLQIVLLSKGWTAKLTLKCTSIVILNHVFYL